MLNVGVNNLWASPIYKATLSDEETQSILNEVICAESVDIDSCDILRGKSIELYSKFLEESFGVDLSDYDYNLHAWMTGRDGGYEMDPHNHSGAQFVSIFYLVSEESDQGGELVVQDPRFNASRAYTPSFKPHFSQLEYTPKSGEVLLFPGYLYHFVRKYNSSMRIAVPVDIFIKE